jgi:hypothetical protein
MAADGLVNRGNTLKEVGRVSEAIQDYIRAVAICPTMAEGHANLASAYKDRLLLNISNLSTVTLIANLYLFVVWYCICTQ